MAAKMTRERAAEFGAAWNSHDADLVASYFADDGVYHASVGPDALGKTYVGKAEVRRGVQAFFDRYPDGKFENLKVNVAGDFGTFEWDFVVTDASGKVVRPPAAISWSSSATGCRRRMHSGRCAASARRPRHSAASDRRSSWLCAARRRNYRKQNVFVFPPGLGRQPACAMLGDERGAAYGI